MAAPPLLQRSESQRQCPGEPELVRHLRDQRAARVRHQPGSVRRDIYGYMAPIAHHV